MKKSLQTLAVLTLMVWGVLFLYFYTSGRIKTYLDPSFHIYALLSGIGLLLLAAFNFLSRNRAVGLCTHDHAHGEPCDHDHHHDHHHDHEEAGKAHDHSACGHDHGDHEHHSDHGGHEHACCGHEPNEGAHTDHAPHHEHACCGHDHEKKATPALAHSHEDSSSGILFSLIVLLVPVLVATAYSHDRFSAGYLAKWGKIERQMMQKRIADSRKSQATPPVGNPYTQEGIDASQAEPKTVAAKGSDGAAPPQGAETSQGAAPTEEAKADGGEAWGAFTLEDLKKMVPQNDKGEFLLDVPQIFYTAGDKELMTVMEGIPVETTAQLMEETLHNPDKTRLKAFRLFIECCAADARPLSIPIDFGKAPPEYKEMGWYKLYGKLHYSHEHEEIVPLIQIERIEATTEPTDGLLF